MFAGGESVFVTSLMLDGRLINEANFKELTVERKMTIFLLLPK